MLASSQWKTCSLCFALAWPVFAAGPALVVDRGLPQGNLNNAAGQYRSNIRWSLYDSGFLGDDFTVGASGESWVIDSIRVWTVPGVNKVDPEHLGDYYQDVRLYFGGAEDGLTPLVTGQLSAGSNQSSNSNILIADVTAAGGASYQDIRRDMHVWQVDFTQLNLRVQGGEKYRFAAWGLGRVEPAVSTTGKPKKLPKDRQTYAWFNAAANAEYASTRQDGADGSILEFTSGGKFESAFNGKGAGWDKGSDINVQVFAHRVQ
ncbi:MAG TPA: hypothetical protein VME17_19615 [Bryobacteraceae bacterium]|nr:hypothetical protein [Bryobacteraceae bacterium]